MYGGDVEELESLGEELMSVEEELETISDWDTDINDYHQTFQNTSNVHSPIGTGTGPLSRIQEDESPVQITHDVKNGKNDKTLTLQMQLVSVSGGHSGKKKDCACDCHLPPTGQTHQTHQTYQTHQRASYAGRSSRLQADDEMSPKKYVQNYVKEFPGGVTKVKEIRSYYPDANNPMEPQSQAIQPTFSHDFTRTLSGGTNATCQYRTGGVCPFNFRNYQAYAAPGFAPAPSYAPPPSNLSSLAYRAQRYSQPASSRVCVNMPQGFWRTMDTGTSQEVSGLGNNKLVRIVRYEPTCQTIGVQMTKRSDDKIGLLSKMETVEEKLKENESHIESMKSKVERLSSPNSEAVQSAASSSRLRSRSSEEKAGTADIFEDAENVD